MAHAEVDAQMRRQKQAIAAALVAAVDGWPAPEAGAWLEMSAGLVSDLKRGRVDRVSMDRLLRSAMRLGLTVHVDVRALPASPPAPPSEAPASVWRRDSAGTGVGLPASERARVSEPGRPPRSRQ
ncbi:MAG: helix-turn-helix domain-containing protein [Gemmatimonadaceae bacterium]|nr:helix-turn-helix domain-containing protein [Gemmatimonadaceae bacterium]